MATLYSRLGGHVMKWSNLKGQQWGGSTLPMNHDGEFYNIELKVRRFSELKDILLISQPPKEWDNFSDRSHEFHDFHRVRFVACDFDLLIVRIN